MKTKHIALLSTSVLIGITACHKDKTPTPVDTTPTSAQVISDFAVHVAAPDYTDLYNNAITFQTAEATFYANPNDNDLNTMRTSWKAIRAAYESAEGFLLGPIASNNLDPDIDTWPVEQNELDSILNSTTTLDVTYVGGLQSSLRGFHPVEYLIFGTTGSTTAASFTVTTSTPAGPRKKEYLHALTADMVNIVAQIKSAYVAGSNNDFITTLNTAGSNSTYPTHKSALLDLVNAMSGICDEVGGSASDGKINSVFTTQDVTLQESYFSNNSWADFTNNITGVRNVYTCTYNGVTGKSLHDLVAAKNLSLDNTIMTSINNAIGSFSAASAVPFGQAITTRPTDVKNVMNAIDSLQSTLDNKLIPFINQYVTD